MKIWTWAEIKEKVKDDLDLNAEVFIDEDELLGYGNQALDEAEQEVMNLYAKYFETDANLTLVSGTSVYSLPSDIYATKIQLIQYNDGGTRYEIKPIKNLRDIAYIQENDAYRYRIVNSQAQGLKLKLYPTSRESSSSNVTIYYLRSVTEFTTDSSTLEIPEAAQFIIQHIKDSCINKEAGTLYSAPPSPALEKQRELFRATLSEMAPDGNNMIEPDTSFYDDFDTDIHRGEY